LAPQNRRSPGKTVGAMDMGEAMHELSFL